MVGKNAVEVILTGEFERKHPVFPVSLLKPYKKAGTSPSKGMTRMRSIVVVPVLQPEEKTFLKILKQKRVKHDNKDVTLYLVRYKHKSADHDEWLPAEKVPNSKVNLRAFRAINRDHTLVKNV